MDVKATKTDFKTIEPFRQRFLQESNFQIRYDACHARGWADHYLLSSAGTDMGYGAVKGGEIPERNTVFEFFIEPAFRRQARAVFTALLRVARPDWIECQSNDSPLFAMLCEFARSIEADTVLFGDQRRTYLVRPECIFRKRFPDETVFEHQLEPVGDYVLEAHGMVVATGGFLAHYNPPFADLHVEVRHDCRGKGFGTQFLQEIKKECYRARKVPAGRCGIRNHPSRMALLKSGMEVCGFMLKGRVLLSQ
jgi:GNAT superfamily N-acetyltransferase